MSYILGVSGVCFHNNHSSARFFAPLSSFFCLLLHGMRRPCCVDTHKWHGREEICGEDWTRERMNEKLLETTAERIFFKWNLQVAHLNLHEKFMSWDWGVYTTLSAKWNEMKKKAAAKLKSTWAMLYKASHEARQRIKILNSSGKLKIACLPFISAQKQQAKRLFSSPILPAPGENLVCTWFMNLKWNVNGINFENCVFIWCGATVSRI